MLQFLMFYYLLLHYLMLHYVNISLYYSFNIVLFDVALY